jgi:hypothetical protein
VQASAVECRSLEAQVGDLSAQLADLTEEVRYFRERSEQQVGAIIRCAPETA